MRILGLSRSRFCCLLFGVGLLAGCVVYKPSSTDPARLATVEELAFSFVPPPAHPGYAPMGPASVFIGRIDGATPLGFTSGRKPLEIDPGFRVFDVGCRGYLQRASSGAPMITYEGGGRIEATLEPGEDYLLLGEMVGPDISYGVEIWIEQHATGAAICPRLTVAMYNDVALK